MATANTAARDFRLTGNDAVLIVEPRFASPSGTLLRNVNPHGENVYDGCTPH
jgi:hypothetical protein